MTGGESGGEEPAKRERGALSKLGKAVQIGSLAATLHGGIAGSVDAQEHRVLGEAEKAVSEIQASIRKQRAQDPYQRILFFDSDAWAQTPSEVKSAFVRDVLYSSDKSAQTFTLLERLMDSGNRWRKGDPAGYGSVMREIQKANPTLLLRLYGSRNIIVTEEDMPALRLALVDPRTDAQTRTDFASMLLLDPFQPPELHTAREELLRLVPPEELNVARTIEPQTRRFESLEERNLYEAAHGKTSSSFDPALQHLNEVSADDLLPPAIREKPAAEAAEWRVMIARNLYFKNEAVNREAVNREAVNREAERIEAFRKTYESYPLFGHTIIAVHDELRLGAPVFGKPAFIGKVREIAPSVKVISTHLDHEAGNFKTTGELRVRAREDLFTSVRDAPSPLTLVVDTHGSADNNGAFYLSGKRLSQRKELVGITAEEIVFAFEKRYENEAIRNAAFQRPDVIIMGQCYSSNMVRYVLETLREKKLPLPIIIASTEFGQLSYGDDRIYGADFFANTILRSDKGTGPAVGQAIEYDPQQSSSNPVVTVPDGAGNFMQLSDAAWFARTTDVG